MVAIDIVILVFLGVVVLFSYSKGLIKTLFGFFSTLFTLIIAYMAYPFVSGCLLKITKLNTFISNKVAFFLDLKGQTEKLVTPQDQITYINQMHLPHYFKNVLLNNNNVEIYKLMKVDSIELYIEKTLTTLIINGIGFFATFLIAFVVIQIIALSLDLVSKLPIIKQVNKSAGAGVGLIIGIILICTIALMLDGVMAMGYFKSLKVSIDQSVIAKLIVENNPLSHMTTNIVKAY